jgi:hypothetical protein
MRKAFFWSFFLVGASVLVLLSFISCDTGSSAEIYTLSGTLTKSGIADGTRAYVKLVAQGGAPTDAALYWAISSAFSGETATYVIDDIDSGTYTQYSFIDVDGSATGDGTSMPDAGDWMAGGNDVVINTDQTSDVGETDWSQIPPSKQDGTLTMGLINAFSVDGKRVVFGVFDAGADPLSDPLLAGGDFDVTGGSGSGTANEVVAPYGAWIGTGGTSYDVYLWVDMDGDSATVQYPESGVDMRLTTYPVTVEIDDDVSLTYQGSDLETVP